MALRQVGDRLELTWTAPSRNTDDTTEKLELREARVLRRVLDLDALVKAQTVPIEPEAPPEPEAPGTAEPEAEPAVVEAEPAEARAEAEPGLPETEGAPAGEAERTEEAPPVREPPTLAIPPFGGHLVATVESEVPGERLVYEETVEPSWIGKRLEYAVVYVNRRGRESPRSPLVAIDPLAAVEPPRDVTAEAGDGFVKVSWRPPAGGPSEALAYAVYRRPQSATEFPEPPLASTPVRGLVLEDRSAPFGTPLCYAVKALWQPPEEAPAEPEEDVPEAGGVAEAEEGPRDLVPIVPPVPSPPPVESRLSQESCLTAIDRFPPPAPSDLVAVAAPAGILLTWREVEAPDLAGYRVYRSDRPTGAFELLSEVTGGSYTDESASPDRAYYYAVTAIDDAPSVNESQRTNVVAATRPSPR